MKRILLILLALRLFMLLLSASNGLFTYGQDGDTWNRSDSGYRYRVVENRLLDPLSRFDGNAYLTIAFVGYDRGHDIRSNTAFFPGYPWVTRLVHVVLVAPILSPEDWGPVLPSFLSAVLTSLLLTIGSLFLFRSWVMAHFDAVIADRAMLLLLLLPAGCVLHFVMSESTFLFFLLAAFVAAERRVFWLAALAAAGCALTRSIGVVVVLPLFVCYMEDRREGEGASWAWFAIPPLALLGLFFHMAEVNGSFFAYFHQQNNFFYHKSFPSLQGIAQLFRIEGKGWVHLARDAVQILMSAWAVVGIALLWQRLRGNRHRYSLVILSILLVGLPLLSGALGAMHRYVIVVFPLIAIWAAVIPDRRIWRGLMIGLFVLQMTLFVFWIHNHPILT